MRMGPREVVGVVARRQLISERGEGDDQVDSAPDGRANGSLDRPGICGGGEHVFAKLIRASDGRGANACSCRVALGFWLYQAEVRTRPCMGSCKALQRLRVWSAFSLQARADA